MRPYRVEHHAPLFVFFKAQIQHLAQKTPALRHAKQIRALQTTGARIAFSRRAPAQKRRGIAHRQKTRPHQQRIRGAIHHVVNHPRLEAALHCDMSRVGEAPPFARQHHCGRAAVLAHGDGCIGVIQINARIGDVITIRQRQHLGRFVGTQTAADESAHARHSRRIQRHQTILARHIDLPTHPRHRITLTHQKTIAEIFCRGRVRHTRRAVEHFNRHFAPAIGHVEQQFAVAFFHVHRFEQIKVRGEFDFALGVARRKCHVGDALMQRVHRVHRKADGAGDFFVGAAGAEGLAVEYGAAGLDVERGGHG